MGFNYSSFALETSDVIGFTESQRTSIEMQVTTAIVDEGKLEYKNLKYPRFRNFYGYCQLMSGAYVVKSIALEYVNQEVCHWQESSPGINQGVGCATKKILAALTPPSIATVTVGLLRQRFTSIRFRLSPLVKANVSLTWHVLDPLCEDEIVQPPSAQGQPIPPNNKTAPPGGRPPNQDKDAADRSLNDGNDNPNDNRPHEPVPGGDGTSACWHASGTTVQGSCDGSPYSYAYRELTNPLFKPVYVAQGPNPPCPNATDGILLYGGVEVDKPTGIISLTFDYY